MVLAMVAEIPLVVFLILNLNGVFFISLVYVGES